MKFTRLSSLVVRYEATECWLQLESHWLTLGLKYSFLSPKPAEHFGGAHDHHTSAQCHGQCECCTLRAQQPSTCYVIACILNVVSLVSWYIQVYSVTAFDGWQPGKVHVHAMVNINKSEPLDELHKL